MLREKMTVLEAAHEFVREMNAIPQDMIAKLMTIDPDDWSEVTVFDDDGDYYRDVLPMWGTMWSFGDSLDDYWLEEMRGIEAMSKCGFRIYYNEEWGYFFGIDGAGYDFYEAHWCPLYRARGLKWHDPDTDMEKNDG